LYLTLSLGLKANQSCERVFIHGPSVVYHSSQHRFDRRISRFSGKIQFSGNQLFFVDFTYSKDSSCVPADISGLNESVASISKYTLPLRSTRRRSIMPNEDFHDQSVIADLQAKLIASQADYASLQAAFSHESTPLATTNKDAEIAKLKTKLGDLEGNAAESDANLKRLHGQEVEKFKQDIADAQSAATDARHEFAQAEAALRQEITKLSSGIQEHERIAAKLDRITLANEQERQRLQSEISTLIARAEDERSDTSKLRQAKSMLETEIEQAQIEKAEAYEARDASRRELTEQRAENDILRKQLEDSKQSRASSMQAERIIELEETLASTTKRLSDVMAQLAALQP
jgi:chromosome segregation ATPase